VGTSEPARPSADKRHVSRNLHLEESLVRPNRQSLLHPPPTYPTFPLLGGRRSFEACGAVGVGISCASCSPRDRRREGDLPEVRRYLCEGDSHGPLVVVCKAYMHHPAFLLLPGALVLNQNRLPFSHRSGERNQSAVRVHRDCAGQLTEGFSRDIHSVNKHGHRQTEPLASASLRADPRGRRIHKLESRAGN